MMRFSQVATLVAGDPEWRLPAMAIAAGGVLLAVWLGGRRQSALKVATLCRAAGWLLICACLVNPLWSSARPRKGANVLAVVTDASRSHLVTVEDGVTRSDRFAELLNTGESREANGWLNRIEQDFELQRYLAGDRLQRVDNFEQQEFQLPASNICTALEQLQQRFDGQPLAAVVLLSDGNATDSFEALDSLKTLAPVYPVVLPEENSAVDVGIGAVTVNQTAFDDAPVTIAVQTRHIGAQGRNVKLTLLDQDRTPLMTKTQDADSDSTVRFQVRPDTGGTVFYHVRVDLLDDNGEPVTEEATTINNERMVAVDRGSEKRRVLYVSGRPNWEFKFLRRAVETDPQTDLVGLIRIARREAKFDFRGREGESSNSLFRGFDETEQELAEEYDEPVLIGLGTKDDELDGGFPEDAEELFAYDALIVDDLEARFFTADQLQLIYEFVAKRGGGFLMMGGQESFRQGQYDRTPIGELLPIDLHRDVAAPTGPVRMSLTRDGWLQPWVRLRSDEAAETSRLDQMPEFLTLNATSFIRPGAVVMSTVQDSGGTQYPALVTQRFGRGRAAALCLGDFWRWRMNEGRRKLEEYSLQLLDPSARPVPPGGDPAEDLNDHARACRQMVRWLVADVPKRLDVSVKPQPALGTGTVKLVADLKGGDFEVREDADVKFTITGPDGKTLPMAGEPSEDVAGRFEAIVFGVEPGAWQARVVATFNDGQTEPEQLQAQVGWASQPDQQEMSSVTANRRLLEEVATTTGGRLIDSAELDRFVDDLSRSDAPLVEVWSWPVWHQWWIFAIAVGCFVSDWTLRRRHGLP